MAYHRGCSVRKDGRIVRSEWQMVGRSPGIATGVRHLARVANLRREFVTFLNDLPNDIAPTGHTDAAPMPRRAMLALMHPSARAENPR
jgi:hypothetical protein